MGIEIREKERVREREREREEMEGQRNIEIEKYIEKIGRSGESVRMNGNEEWI